MLITRAGRCMKERKLKEENILLKEVADRHKEYEIYVLYFASSKN